MDVSSVTKTVSGPSTVAKSVGSSLEGQSATSVGKPLPAAEQVSARANTPFAPSPVSPSNFEELSNLVEQANVTLQMRSSDLKFTVAEGTDISVVRIEDAETGELIRQVPSEAMVAIARALDQAQRDRGMMFEEKA